MTTKRRDCRLMVCTTRVPCYMEAYVIVHRPHITMGIRWRKSRYLGLCLPYSSPPPILLTHMSRPCSNRPAVIFKGHTLDVLPSPVIFPSYLISCYLAFLFLGLPLLLFLFTCTVLPVVIPSQSFLYEEGCHRFHAGFPSEVLILYVVLL